MIAADIRQPEHLPEGPATVVVPISAMTESDGSRAVFIVDRVGSLVRKVPVAVAGIAAEGVRIASGLNPGYMVVSAGVQFLRDGMPVRLADAQ